jgi:AcrR family transcriptional regulator
LREIKAYLPVSQGYAGRVARPTDTRARILATARELFARRGVQQVSLRDIAEALGITKPALYYHFDSREALLASIVAPLLADMDAFLAAREGTRPDLRILMADYFDLLLVHRELITMLVRDLATLGMADLATRMIAWRQRLMELMLGPGAPVAAHVRAVVAIGGLSDCTISFPGVPMEKIRATAVEAACAALGVAPAEKTVVAEKTGGTMGGTKKKLTRGRSRGGRGGGSVASSRR